MTLSGRMMLVLRVPQRVRRSTGRLNLYTRLQFPHDLSKIKMPIYMMLLRGLLLQVVQLDVVFCLLSRPVTRPWPNN